MKNPEKFLAEAKKGIVTVEFTKIDTGELRVMPCTLNDVIAKRAIVINEMTPDSHNFVVWSLDKKAYRSFRVSTVKDWYVGTKKEESIKGSDN